MQDLRDDIVIKPIWAVGKLKRVQSRRDGGANIVYLQIYSDDNMQNIHTYTQYTQCTIRHT